MKPRYQSLPEWMNNPFGAKDHVKNQSYDEKYSKFVSSNKIRIVGFTEIEGSYYIHLMVPSESQDSYEYDVVIRFFTNSPEVAKESSLRNYYIQFYSNSPGFIYKYAVLYKNAGFLIEMMYDKLDPNFIDKLPEKTNASMTVSYDKSIYFACKYLSENKFKVLHKRGAPLRIKQKKPDEFFRGIKSFERLKMDQDMMGLEKRFKKELQKSGAKKSVIPKPQIPDTFRKPKVAKKTATRQILNHGVKPGITTISKKSGSKITKKGPRRSTRRP